MVQVGSSTSCQVWQIFLALIPPHYHRTYPRFKFEKNLCRHLVRKSSLTSDLQKILEKLVFQILLIFKKDGLLPKNWNSSYTVSDIIDIFILFCSSRRQLTFVWTDFFHWISGPRNRQFSFEKIDFFGILKTSIQWNAHKNWTKGDFQILFGQKLDTGCSFRSRPPWAH